MLDLSASRDEILSIAALHGGHDLRVFGSRVRGTAGISSDLDLLLRLEPRRTLLDLIAIKQDLEDFLDIDVDVVTEASVSPYLREQVLAEAVAL